MKSTTKISNILVVLLFIVSLKGVFATTAELDTAFGTGGKVIIAPTEGDDIIKRVLVQPDGKIVVFGRGFGEVSFVIRTNPDGTRDASFGTNGLVTINANALGMNDIALKPGGGMVLTGYFVTIFNTYDAAIYDVDEHGSASFRNTTTWNDCPGRRILVLPDGRLRIVALCTESAPGGMGKLAVIGYDTTGDLDLTFGQDGIARTDINVFVGQDELAPDAVFESLGQPVMQPDGKIVVTLYGYNSAGYAAGITRFNANGSLDKDFGFRQFGDIPYPTGMALQRDGNIVFNGVMASYGGGVDSSFIARVNLDGSFDSRFGDNGFGGIHEPDPNTRGLASALAIQPNGRIVTAGMRDGLYALSRYRANGTLDNTFGTNGIFTLPMGNNPGRDSILSIAMQPDGKLVAAGRVKNTAGKYDVGLVRLNLKNPTPFDYDGDGRADISVWRQSNGTWFIDQSTSGYRGMTWGVETDKLTPADYDGDGTTDIAVWRPSTGTWYFFNSQTQSFVTYTWGGVGDIPVPADHDGDGKADLVIFRPSTGTWYTRFSNNTFSTVSFGVEGDKPVVGDFDGDGKSDIAVHRPSDGNWHILKTGFGYFVQTWGEPGDIAVPADYDGDGSTDVAVWRPSTGQWYRIRSRDGFDVMSWGVAGDIPIPADYDGDGKADVAVFRPSDGTWYIVGTTGGQWFPNFGQNGDVPTQSAFIY